MVNSIKKYSLLILLGLLLRLVLIPITLHPDFRAVNLAGYLIAQKGYIFSFYDYLSHLPRDNPLVLLYGDGLFIYPPLAYQLHAVFNKILYPFYPQSAFWILIEDIGKLRSDPGFAVLMYLLKTPYLIADIVCFWLLLRLFPPQKHKLVIGLWWFNPVVIYTCYLMGQFDIFIAFFILLTYYSIRFQSILPPIFIGIAAAFKPFPLILLPLLPGNKLKNIIIGGCTYIFTLLPFLNSSAFKQYALLASQSDKLFFAKMYISATQFIPVFLFSLVLIYWWNYYHPKSLPSWIWLATPLLLFYSVTHYHPQWFIWVIPLLVIAVINKPNLNWIYWSIIFAHLLIILFFEPSLNFGLFNINFTLSSYVSKWYPPDTVVSLIRTALAATSFAFLKSSKT